MAFTQPTNDPVPGVLAKVAEGRFGHPMTKVGAPALQHRIELAQQDRQSGCDDLLVSARTRPTIEVSAFFDG